MPAPWSGKPLSCNVIAGKWLSKRSARTYAGKPSRSPSRSTAPRKNPSWRSTTLCVCPNSSKLTRPNSASRPGRRGPPTEARDRREPHRLGGARGQGRVRPARPRIDDPGREPVDHDPAEQHADPRRRPHGGLGRRVPGHRRAVDQRVLVRVRQRPVADRAAHRVQPRPQVRPRRGGLGLLGGGAQRVVGVDDQGREQVVPAGEVPVDRRRRHAQLPGDRSEGEPGRALGGEVPPGGVGDLAGQGGPDTGAGSGGGHRASLARMRIADNNRERCSAGVLSRASGGRTAL